MNDIICPHCKKTFKVDESGFANILKQVRDEQFEKELKNLSLSAEQERKSAVELAKAEIKNSTQADLAKKDKELVELNSAKERERMELLMKKDSEITEMKSKLHNAELEKKLAVSEAVNRIEKERDELSNELKNKDTEKQLLSTSLKEIYAMELKTKDDIIRLKDEEIALRKDMKVKLSTKMLGETLEQHCETEFNKLRSTGFQKAYFEKDNDAKTGSKGDYIFRETAEDGNEIISIMFEMKNEGDATATKKKNEDFFA